MTGRPSRTLTIACASLLWIGSAVAAPSADASGKTLFVFNPAANGANSKCVPVTNPPVPATNIFTTIQGAVNKAATDFNANKLSADTIDVCPGTYPEQVAITAPLTLVGVRNLSGSRNQAIIASPRGGLSENAMSLVAPLTYAAQIVVRNAKQVAITNLTVDGTGNGLTDCSPALVGVLYQNTPGTISAVAARSQKLTDSLSSCQSGTGILVESNGPATAPTFQVNVQSDSVHDYQSAGIVGNGKHTKIVAMLNQVKGLGPASGATQTGIEVGVGAAGQVTSNSIIDDLPNSNPPPLTPSASSVGILVFAAKNAQISGNIVGNVQVGVRLASDTLLGAADHATVKNNTIFGAQLFDGIDLCSNFNTATSNSIANAALAAIHLDAACGSTGTSETIASNAIDEACYGVLDDSGSVTNTFSNNLVLNAEFILVTGAPPPC